MRFDFVLEGFDRILGEVLTAVTPVLVLFLIFILFFKMPRRLLAKLFTGVVFAFAGLALFLQGVKVGFMPVGMEMGYILGGMEHRWILIPIGFILGFAATLAEPAVRILCRQVEKSSRGYIRSSVIMFTLCLAVGIFIALGMTRVVYGIPFYYIIIPGYLLAMILMFFSKPSFTAIAFDSGGVATGPMTVTFIMALAVGAADAIEGRDAVVDGFGLIAMVALAPIILVMLIGFFYPNEPALEESDAEGREAPPGNGGRPGPGDKPGNGDPPGPGDTLSNVDPPGYIDKPGESDPAGNETTPGNGGRPGPGDKPGNGDPPGSIDKPGESDPPGSGDRPVNGDPAGNETTPGNGGRPGSVDKPGNGDPPRPGDSLSNDDPPAGGSPVERQVGPENRGSRRPRAGPGISGTKGPASPPADNGDSAKEENTDEP